MIIVLLKKGSLPLLLLFLCCSPNYKPVNASDIKFDVLWRVPVHADSNQKMIIDNETIYFSEKMNGGAIAINAVSGEIKWRDKHRDYFISNPLLFENGYIGYISKSNNWSLYLYNTNGEFIKSIICPDDKYLLQGFNVLTYKNDVYWNSSGYGLTRININEDIYFDKETDTWRGSPKLVYKWPENGDNFGVRYTPPIIKDNILYGGFNNRRMQPGIFFAINLKKNKLIWESTSGSLYAYSRNPFKIINKKLIVQDAIGYGIIDSSTGEFEVSISGLDNPYGKGFYFYDDKVYFTNENSATIKKNNIFCLDVNTGETIWQLSRPFSHGSNPVCHKDVMYIAMQNSIDVYNAQTGEYLGSDSSLRGDEWQICNVLKFNNTLIFRNLEEIVCVKMDFIINKKGELCQK